MFDVNVRHKCMIHDKMSTSVLKRSFFYFSRKKELSFYCQRFELFRDPQSVSVFVKKMSQRIKERKKICFEIKFFILRFNERRRKTGGGKGRRTESMIFTRFPFCGESFSDEFFCRALFWVELKLKRTPGFLGIGAWKR